MPAKPAKDTKPAAGGTLLIDAFQIRDSKFLRATKVNGKLVIEDMTIRAAKKMIDGSTRKAK